MLWTVPRTPLRPPTTTPTPAGEGCVGNSSAGPPAIPPGLTSHYELPNPVPPATPANPVAPVTRPITASPSAAPATTAILASALSPLCAGTPPASRPSESPQSTGPSPPASHPPPLPSSQRDARARPRQGCTSGGNAGHAGTDDPTGAAVAVVEWQSGLWSRHGASIYHGQQRPRGNTSTAPARGDLPLFREVERHRQRPLGDWRECRVCRWRCSRDGKTPKTKLRLVARASRGELILTLESCLYARLMSRVSGCWRQSGSSWIWICATLIVVNISLDKDWFLIDLFFQEDTLT